MTILPDKTTRDNLNIDTIDRGIAYSAHLLRSVTNDVIDFSYNVTLVDENPTGNLGIRATLNYDPISHFSSGSDYLQGLLTNVADNPVELFAPMLPADGGVAIPPDDSRVISLEHYLVWLIQLKLLEDLNNELVDTVIITQGISSQIPFKVFTLNLTYNPLIFFSSGNIIEAINHSSLSVNTDSGLFDNTTKIDNNLILGN